MNATDILQTFDAPAPGVVLGADCVAFPRTGQIWSLLDMLRIFAAPFFSIGDDFEDIAERLTHDEFGDEDASAIKAAVARLASKIGKLPTSPSLRTQLARFARKANETDFRPLFPRSVLIALIYEIKANFYEEMSSQLMLIFPQERRELYEQTEPLFGVEVASRFPAANRDIAAAGRCLAVGEWTAGVFHLMRILEHGLRDLADRVGATFPTGIENENWNAIIEKIESEVRNLGKTLPKGTAKSETLEFYGKAASQFWHFKEAWRNHVAHSRLPYDEVEAMKVYTAVKHFMQQLATAPEA